MRQRSLKMRTICFFGALDPDRVLALLREARVVDGPGHDGLLLLQLLDNVPRSLPPHATVVPRALPQKVEQPSLDALALHRGRDTCTIVIAACCVCRNGLNALPLAVRQDAVGVRCERLPLLASSEKTPDPDVEELPEPALHRVVIRERHGRARAPCRPPAWTSRTDATAKNERTQ